MTYNKDSYLMHAKNGSDQKIPQVQHRTVLQYIAVILQYYTLQYYIAKILQNNNNTSNVTETSQKY